MKQQLVIKSNMATYLNDDYFKKLFSQVFLNKPKEIRYSVFTPIDGIIDRKKLFEKVSEQINKYIEEEEKEIYNLEIKNKIAKKIKKLNSKKIFIFDEEKRNIETAMFLNIENTYDLENIDVSDILYTSKDFYENYIKQVIVLH